MDTTLTQGTTRPLAVLISVDFDISFIFEDLAIALGEFEQLNCTLATGFEGSDEVKVHGLIGIGLIQFIKDASVVCSLFLVREVSLGCVVYFHLLC